MSALEDLLLRAYQNLDASSDGREAAPDCDDSPQDAAAPCDGSLDESVEDQMPTESAMEDLNAIRVQDDVYPLNHAFTESVVGLRVFGGAWQDEIVQMGNSTNEAVAASMEAAQGERLRAFAASEAESVTSEPQLADSHAIEETIEETIATPPDVVTEVTEGVAAATATAMTEVELPTAADSELATDSELAADSELMADAPLSQVTDEIASYESPETTALEDASPDEPQEETPHLQFSDAVADLPEDKTTEQHSQATPFRPAWEVNRFVWPAICEHVEDAIEQQLVAVVEQIHEQSVSRPSNVLVLSGVRRSAGSTTMTMCLAREAARQGHSVALVDLNHENPCLMDRLCVACEQGIEALPTSNIALDEICILAVEDGVSLIPMVEPLSPGECAGADVAQLMSVLSANHDFVLVDASVQVVEKLREKSPFPFGVVTVADAMDDCDSDPMVDSDQVWALGVIKNFAA